MSSMKSRALRSALPLLVLSLACGGGGGGGSASGPGMPSYFDSTAYSVAPTASLASAQEKAALSSHSISLGGSSLAYTATVGHLTAKDPVSGQAEASFFYVAYTLDGADPATRPLSFVYNGGPGSSSAYLHLGGFGPKRLVTGDPSTTAPTPFPLVDSADSILDVTDLVFVDPVGTGYSEAIAPNTNQTFWGVDPDAAVLRDFIVRYLAANARQASPKYLFGESYGTPRTAVLADKLEAAGVGLKGLVLQSSILDYYTNPWWDPQAGYNNASLLPSYAAAGAWFHLDTPPPADLPTYMGTLRSYAADSYGPAVDDFLLHGTLSSGDLALVPQLADDTGIPSAVWSSTNADGECFNLSPDWFQVDLLPGSMLGVYDARVSAPLNSPLSQGGDPSSAFIGPSFTAAVPTYLASLGYTNPSSYPLLSDAVNHWDFSHDGQAWPDTIPDLSAALTQDPQLKVFSANGYYDIVTPFFQTEQDLARLGALPFTPALHLYFYGGGHMTYLDDSARPQEAADLKAFYRGQGPWTLAGPGVSPAAERALACSLARPAASLPARASRLGRLPEPLLPARIPAGPRPAPSSGAALRAQVDAKLAREKAEAARFLKP